MTKLRQNSCSDLKPVIQKNPCNAGFIVRLLVNLGTCPEKREICLFWRLALQLITVSHNIHTRHLLVLACSTCPSSWICPATLTWTSCSSSGPWIATSLIASCHANGTSNATDGSVLSTGIACFVSCHVTLISAASRHQNHPRPCHGLGIGSGGRHHPHAQNAEHSLRHLHDGFRLGHHLLRKNACVTHQVYVTNFIKFCLLK